MASRKSVHVVHYLLLSLSVSLCLRASEAESLYPRSLGQIKAMEQLLAAKKGAGVQEEYLQRLKQYRYICGVPFENLQWDDELANLARHASLVDAKLNKLTHTPEHPAGMSDEEYELGKKGAGESNLFMGITKASACVDGWMNDSDKNNIDRVGHRRWCLNPAMLKTGFGTSGNYAAMYAFDVSNPAVPDWDYVCYPARGYMPVQLFGNRHAWSVSLNTSKFATPKDVKISIQPVNEKNEPAGAPLKLDYQHIESSGFGSGTAIIFRPETLDLAVDARYKVEISGLSKSSGEAAVLKYLVHFVNLQKVPAQPDEAAVFTAYFKTRMSSVQAMPDRVDQLEAFSAISQDEFLKMADPAVATSIRKTLSTLTSDSALRKEQDAMQRYKFISDTEQKSGKNNRTEAAVAYRDLAAAYKDTRAGKKAAADFERLKKEIQ